MLGKKRYELTSAEDNGHGEVSHISIPRAEQAAYLADILARCRGRQGVFQKPEWWVYAAPELQPSTQSAA